ncbi:MULTISPECIES: hypothetical protein [Marinomonas]|uniref:Uncharacterized protein n=1 Tax=Marinomonas rhodophyticola TaxID=2992803 RepID=A0ABT3KCK5_9GAMM|nr:hypothetical protein [Marinomonas sp. KJ51-3]MCW4628260.1 hypothetical protein [Marinomonas sp. KJ51-3]
MDEYWNLASAVGQSIYINSDLLASRGADWWTISGVFFSTVTAIAGVIIAAKSHYLSRDEAIKTREHHRLSAKPLLQFQHENRLAQQGSNRRIFSLKLANDGLGPAMVKNIKFNVDGHPIYRQGNRDENVLIADNKGEKDYTYAIQEFLGAEPGVNSTIIPANRLIKVNEEILVLHMVIDKPFAEYMKTIGLIEIEITYTGIYEDEEYTAPYKGV